MYSSLAWNTFRFFVHMAATHLSDPNLKVIYQVVHMRAELVLYMHHWIPCAQHSACMW